MKNLALTICALAFGMQSCYQNLKITYQADKNNTGTLVLKPTRPINKANVVMDGQLLVEDKNVKKITIYNVPAGLHSSNITSDYYWFKKPLNDTLNFEIKANSQTAQIVQVPTLKEGYYVLTIGASLVSIATSYYIITR